MKKILVIDNYDSFVHNAVQLLRESSEPVNITIQLNDRIDFEKFGDYDGVLLSPGPGIPEEAGDLMAAIGQIVRQRIPVLGICLGHQALARAFGAELRQLSAPLHGHPTTLTVTDAGDLLLQKVAPPLIVGRYHSWIVDPDSMPEELIASSHDETGHIMSFLSPESADTRRAIPPRILHFELRLGADPQLARYLLPTSAAGKEPPEILGPLIDHLRPGRTGLRRPGKPPRSILSVPPRTVGADPLDNEIDRFGRKSVRQTHLRNSHPSQAKGTPAMRAIEMGMQVVDFTIAIAATKRIFERTGTVVDAVHQVMRQKKE